MLRTLKSIVNVLLRIRKITKLFYIVWIVSFVMAFNPLINTLLFAKIINDFMNDTLFMVIIHLALLYLLYKIITSLLVLVQKHLIIKMRQKIDMFVRSNIVNFTDSVSAEKFEDNDWYEKKLLRTTRIIGCASDEIIAISGLISTFTSLIIYCIFLSSYSMVMLLFGMVSAFLSITKSVMTQKKLYNQSVQESHLLTKYDSIYGDFFQISASLEMRTFSAFDFVEKIRSSRLTDVFNHRKNVNIKNSLVNLIFLVLRFALCCSMMYYLMFFFHASEGIIIAFIPYTISIMGQLEDISMTFMSIVFSGKEWRDITEFVSEPETKNKSLMDDHLTSSLITCDKVCFSYPNSQQVLHNIKLDIKQGEAIAFVGENGCGKSTLLKILARIYEPICGNVRWNDEVRTGFVFQDIIQYPLSLYENIDPFEFDAEKIKNLAKKVGLDINKYSDVSKIMSPGFENSINISGGEWQKLAIIRMLYYYENEDVYFFDEPTSSLDPISELAIFDMFRKFAEEKTLIFATHRLAIAKYANCIYVMQNGSIVAKGTHQELMEQCDLYRKMYTSQAHWYERGLKC